MSAIPSRSSEMLERIIARWPREPEEIHRWVQGPNEAIVLEFNQHVIGLELIGSFTRESLDVVMPPIEALFARSSSVHLFFDAEALDTHDSVVRDSFVQLLRTHRARWQGVYVLFRSSLIGMTLAAVNLLFRGEIKGFRDHEKFYETAERVLDLTGGPR